MKNKINFLTAFVLLFTMTASYAQLNSLPGNNAEASTEIEGTPYLDEKFVPGVVYQTNSNFKLALRYNMYKDVMEYMQGTVNMYLDPSAKINKVSIGTSVFVSKVYESKHQKKYGFFTLLDSGEVTLYSRKVVSFHKARKGGAPDFKDYLAGFDRESDAFYYQIGNGELIELESIKSMIASLPQKQEELAVFAKKEKISASKEQKVMKFVHYYNTLVDPASQEE